MDKRGTGLEDFRAPVKLKIAALWTATMFCYVYGDYFGLFVRGTLDEMNAGVMGPLGPATPAVLLGVAIMLAVPAVMIFLSLVLPPRFDRWINIVLGAIYTAIMLVSMPGSPLFYIVLGIIEMALTSGIVWYAWTWPRSG